MRCECGLRLQNSSPMRLAMHRPNVWIDLSGWSPKYFSPQLVQYTSTLLIDRMLFGSDFPLILKDNAGRLLARLGSRFSPPSPPGCAH